MLARYRKSIIALVTGNIGWATAVVASPSHGVTAAEWILFATVNATALGVYKIRNAG
jgi:hypothetical protein